MYSKDSPLPPPPPPKQKKNGNVETGVVLYRDRSHSANYVSTPAKGQQQICAFCVFLRWFTFEKVAEALIAKGTYHINLDQLLAVTREVCRIDDQEELTTMLNFYHDLGVIVKHGHTVVLQAQWLIDLFKQLITVRPFDDVVSRVFFLHL